MILNIPTARVFRPLLEPARYKGARGGRASGKSHFFAELLVEEMVSDPNASAIGAREIQKSLQFSSKRLIESKIRSLGVGPLFDVQRDVIYRRGGTGVIVFIGLQDHTADSIKSLEGFKIAWVDEAQRLSHRSLRLLRPTIMRRPESQIWFSWNPDQPTDAVDAFMRSENPPPGSICVEANYLDNPFVDESTLIEVEHDKQYSPDSFDHVWLGGYNKKVRAQIFAGKWRVDEFEPGADWQGPYHGLDFGFSQAPTAAVRLWISGRRLFIEREAFKIGLELDDTAAYLAVGIPDIGAYVLRADSARPESISYLKRHGLPRIAAVAKGKGSVEDGIAFIKSFDEIVIHRRCEEMQREARLYSYKVDKASGDILPTIVAEFNHGWDACVAAGTPVATLRGAVPIEAVRPGDCVATRRGWRIVTAARCTDESAAVLALRTAGGRRLLATADHRVFTHNRDYVRLNSLAPGERLECYDDTGRLVADRVASVEDAGVRAAVYDLAVADAEEFFAAGVLVHNCRYALEPIMRNSDHTARFLAMAS